ncbi:hypothetical protein ACFQLX_18150 [Streptomyces polyrhachis]|uniref:Caspase domain-containing protein n=1 Tax=Streptomyces polyrhachis TaxID=1282885 RepID=A0ABW2GLR4_9ACTN
MSQEPGPGDDNRVSPALSTALLVGGTSYPGSELADVPAAARNLARLRERFADPGLWGLDFIRLQCAENLTRAAFLSSLAAVYKMSDPKGLFVLYFAGHAHYDKRERKLYLASSDTRSLSSPQNSMVALADIFDTVRAIEEQAPAAARKLLILDCCFAGGAMESAPTEASAIDDESGWYIMAAAARNRTALGESDREHTFFTGALLGALEGVKENRPGLSPRWVFETVHHAIARSPDADGALLKPQQSAALWADRPWVRNALHEDPPPRPHVYGPAPTPEHSPAPLPIPDGFSRLPQPEPGFTGRTEELEAAARRFGQRAVLPVYGPSYAGKSAFIRQLLASADIQAASPPEQPWLLMEMIIRNRSGEAPVLGTLASALKVRLHDVDQSGGGIGDPRRELVVDRLRELAQGRTLLLVIDCGRLGYDSRHIRDELEELLAHPYFRDTANIVISRVPVQVEGDQQLVQKAPVRLAELRDEEAAELLTRLLAAEHITVEGAQVLDRVQDGRLRLPGELIRSAQGFISRAEGPGAAGAPDPGAVAAALVEGTAPNLARILGELGCSLASAGTSPALPEPLALLAVWSLADRLALPQSVLEDPAVGFPSRLIGRLGDARVLTTDESGRLLLGRASEHALRTLLLAALKRRADPEDEPDDDDPFVPPRAALDALFPAGLGPDGIDSRLAAAASTLFVVADGSLDSDDERAVGAFQAQLLSALGWIEDDGAAWLPALHEVVCSLVVAPEGDVPYLSGSAEGRRAAEEERAAREERAAARREEEPAQVPAAEEPLEDQEPVLTPVPVPEPALLTHSLFRLYHAVATLTFAARVDGAVAESGDGFTAAAADFAAALADCRPEQVPHALLRSADTSLALTGKRLGLSVRLLDVRLAAADLVHEGALWRGPGQASRITLAVSWLLNTAESLIDANRLPEAGEFADKAASLVGDTLRHDDSPRNRQARLQLNGRVSRVRSRLLTDPAESRRELLGVVRGAVAGLEITYDNHEPLSLWSMRLLESAVLLIQQSASAEELEEARSLVMDALDRCWGERRGWPATLCVAVARFLRRVYARSSDPEAVLRGAHEAVELLEKLPCVAEAAQGDTPHLIPAPRTAAEAQPPPLAHQETANVLSALAQSLGFQARALRDSQRHGAARARLAKAAERARAAIELAPGTFAYSVWLRQVLDIWRTTARTGEAGEAAERRRRTSVRAVRSWLSQENEHSHHHALLDLTCLESDWISQGSLRGAAQQPGTDFLTIHPVVQKREIDAIYRERHQKLKEHRYRYGPSIELCALETRLEREHCRWSGMLEFNIALREKKEKGGPGPVSRAPQVNNNPVFDLFADARRHWPGDPRLIAAEAAFHRYVWRYGKSIELYEHLARTAPNGEVRRVAKLSAAEAMLAEVEYTSADRRPNWHERLMGARELLGSIDSRDSRVGLAAVLRARVAIRLREPVHWEPIDAAFESVVGGDYAGTVGRFLDRRHYGGERTPSRLGDLARITVKRGRGGRDGQDAEAAGGLFRTYLADEEAAGGDEPPAAVPAPAAATAADQEPGQFTSEFLGELLLADFTSVQLLNGLGKLYLDRARHLVTRHEEVEGSAPGPASPTALEAAEFTRRAYDCLDACRMLQEAHGNESIVIKFERGRAVTLAAGYLHRADPFPPQLMRGRRPQIQQAVTLLLTARRHSVGGFNAVCSYAVSQNNDVQTRLGLRDSR